MLGHNFEFVVCKIVKSFLSQNGVYCEQYFSNQSVQAVSWEHTYTQVPVGLPLAVKPPGSDPPFHCNQCEDLELLWPLKRGRLQGQIPMTGGTWI